jgi:hypothetical protein
MKDYSHNKGRALHDWMLWGTWEEPAERCSKCKLSRRIVTVFGGFRQQYRWPGGKWEYGRDGSLMFDHGGVPQCLPTRKR